MKCCATKLLKITNPRTTEVDRGEGSKEVGFDNLPNFPEAVWQTDFEVRQDEESNSHIAKVRDENVTERKITAVRPNGHRIRSKGEVKVSAILKDNVASL